MERWLKTDEYKEAVSALEFVLESASKLSTDICRWRWVILSLHSALQGFMVIALRHSDGSGPVPNDIIVRILTAHRNKQPQPDEMLHKFLVLYRLLRGQRMERYIHSKRFRPQGTQSWSVRRLNMLRNEFIHFTPKGWSLEVSGLPHICLDCLGVIRFLQSESGNIFWHNDSLRERASTAILACTDFFTLLHNDYENGASPCDPANSEKNVRSR